MKNLKIGLRIGLAYILILFLFIATFTINFSSIEKVSASLGDFYSHPFKANNLIWNIKIDLMEIQVNMFKSASENDKDMAQQYISLAQSKLEDLEKLKAELEEIYTGDEKYITQLSSYIAQSNEYKEQIFEYLSKEEDAKALEIINNDYLPLIERVIANIGVIAAYEETVSLNYLNEANNIKKHSKRSLASNCVFIIVVIIILWVVITLSIIKPIKEIEKAAGEMCKGNLKIDIKYKAKDEIGSLAESMRSTVNIMNGYISNISDNLKKLSQKDLSEAIEMEYVGDFVNIKEAMIDITDNYNRMIKKIRGAAERVSTGAQQIATAAQALETGASDQSSAVEQLVATVHNVTDQVEVNANNANDVNDLSSNSVNEIEKGNSSMQDLLEAMKQIEEQSKQTANIIKVINNIAHQTNLLALNAGIEAARAGDNGLGFAVVATSIGNLAGECSQAAKNTEELINKTMAAVYNGTQLAGETADVLNHMVQSVSKTSTLVGNISEACTNQSKELKEILQGIQQIAVVVETNSSTAAETSASSEELLTQAESLDEMMKKFKVR